MLSPPLATLLHPLTAPGPLPVSPSVAAGAAAALVAAVALAVPRGSGQVVQPSIGDHSWAAPLTNGRIVGRVAGAMVLILAVAAGRGGESLELENLAPALVIGVAWPTLVLASAVLGPVWRWVDPWDGMARVVARGPSEPSADVRWAAAPALAWAWYLSAFPEALRPRNVGAALGAYTILVLAGCLAVGRRAFLSRVEVFGMLFTWVGRLPRGRLPGWRPPGSAEIVLGVLAGGLLFGFIRLSDLWGRLNVVPLARTYAVLGVVGAAAAGALVLWTLARRTARRAPGSVAAAVVPAVASIAVALAMSRNRLFTSFQLLPRLILDPFGFGEDMGASGIDPNPLGTTGLTLAQMGVLLAGHLAGAFVLAGRAARRSRIPATIALCALVAAGVLAITTGQFTITPPAAPHGG